MLELSLILLLTAPTVVVWSTALHRRQPRKSLRLLVRVFVPLVLLCVALSLSGLWTARQGLTGDPAHRATLVATGLAQATNGLAASVVITLVTLLVTAGYALPARRDGQSWKLKDGKAGKS